MNNPIPGPKKPVLVFTENIKLYRVDEQADRQTTNRKDRNPFCRSLSDLKISLSPQYRSSIAERPRTKSQVGRIWNWKRLYTLRVLLKIHITVGYEFIPLIQYCGQNQSAFRRGEGRRKLRSSRCKNSLKGSPVSVLHKGLCATDHPIQPVYTNKSRYFYTEEKQNPINSSKK